MGASVVRRFMRYIPFVGRLVECNLKDLWQAFVEVVIATVFSTMPLWFLRLLGPMFLKAPTNSDAIRTGELFLFSAALVGPLVYIITKNYGEREESEKSSFLRYRISFPYGSGFVFFCVFICIISSFAFSVLRNPLFKEDQLRTIINYEGVIDLSWWVFWISVAVFFCATAYRNSIEHIGESLRSDERDFARQWEQRK